jgi:hypothetical protein
MFCPRCQAEYPSHVHRCSDCDVPLVERLTDTHGDSERMRVSGFVLFKEWGVFIVIPVMFLATVLVFIALRDNRFEIQIASIVAYTGSVFLFVFCDAGPGLAIKAKGTKGFSLGEKAVRQKLPQLVCIHVVCLVVLFAGMTGAMWLRPRAVSLASRYWLFRLYLAFCRCCHRICSDTFFQATLRARSRRAKKWPNLTITTCLVPQGLISRTIPI